MKTEDSLYKKLSSEIENCDWNSLSDHFDRGAILSIDSSLDLSEVGVAMADDDAKTIDKWIHQSLIKKPSIEDKDIWSKTPKAKVFRFLIIQPYVLIQLLS